MEDYDMQLRFPNIGQPCLVQISNTSTFKVLFAGVDPNLDLKTRLKDRLFLQRLPDTRKVLQENINKLPADRIASIYEWKNKWDYNLWPPQIKDALIPLEITNVEQPFESPWRGVLSFGTFADGAPYQFDYLYAYWVTLKIAFNDIQNLEAPQLFNLIQTMPSAKAYNVNFHAVYLHDKNWNDFSFIQATDIHVALRNDYIESEVEKAMGYKPPKFQNFNEKFRLLIEQANKMHREGKLDFIVITGDLVDYVPSDSLCVNVMDPSKTHFRRNYMGNLLNFPIIYDNFTFMRNLLVSWEMKAERVGEELEVPLFTVLGNHDYRPSEYPLIATYELDLGIINPDLYSSEDYYQVFGMSRDEALAYESGPSKEMPYYGSKSGIIHQSQLESAPWTYKAFINSDVDFTIPLNKNRIICLESGPDKGAFIDRLDALQKSNPKYPIDDSYYDRRYAAPDTTGFSKEQITFLGDQIKNVDGCVVVACHSPVINYIKSPPPHLFRETEHSQLDLLQLNSLREILKIDEYDNILSGYTKNFSFETWAMQTGWSLLNTPYFKLGNRWPDMSRGVADENFDEFFSTITPKDGSRKNVELLLSGHIDSGTEYRARWMGHGIAFYHDYYLDNTVEHKSPLDYWGEELPKYSSPLNESDNPKKWWQDHSPLFVRTNGFTSPNLPGEISFLHINVQDDTITQINRAIVQVAGPVPFVERVVVINGPKGLKPESFSKLPDKFEICYNAEWETAGSLRQRQKQVSIEKPLNPDENAYIFVRFGPYASSRKNKKLKDLKVKLVGMNNKIDFDIPLSEDIDPQIGLYYWGSFQPVKRIYEYTLQLETDARDASSDIMLDSNPATVAAAKAEAPLYSFSDYEPGVDKNHSIKIRISQILAWAALD